MEVRYLSVSIVLYHTSVEQLRRCLKSLEKFAGNIHLYIVDNSPKDDLKKEVLHIESCTYIHLPSNPGFGAGHNVAILEARKLCCPYHLVLNADVYFDCDVLTPMLNYLDQHPSVGHIMPKVLNSDGSIQRLCKLVPSPSDLLLRRFSTRKTKESRNRRFELHASGYDNIMFVPYLSGCFMLLRQDALRKIGIFDERFFMYPEDIDLTRRIALNYETIFFPYVSVFHEHGAASHKSLKMFFIHLYNIFKYFNKWGWFFDSTRKRLNNKTLDQFER